MCKVMKVIQPDEAEEGTSEDSDDVICLDDPNPKKKSPTKRNKTKWYTVLKWLKFVKLISCADCKVLSVHKYL